MPFRKISIYKEWNLKQNLEIRVSAKNIVRWMIVNINSSNNSVVKLWYMQTFSEKTVKFLGQEKKCMKIKIKTESYSSLSR